MLFLVPLSRVFLLHPQRPGPGLHPSFPTHPRFPGEPVFSLRCQAVCSPCGCLRLLDSCLLAPELQIPQRTRTCLTCSLSSNTVAPGTRAEVGTQDSMTGPHPLSLCSLALTFSMGLPPPCLRKLPSAPTTSLISPEHSPSHDDCSLTLLWPSSNWREHLLTFRHHPLSR